MLRLSMSPMAFTATICLACFLSISVPVSRSAAETEPPPVGSAARSREFRFDYGATLRGIPVDKLARVWIPVPQSNEHQQVRTIESNLPGSSQTNVEPKYGNRILYFEAKGSADGSISLKMSYLIKRHEVRGLADGSAVEPTLREADRKLYLAPNQRVPVVGKHLDLIAGMQFPDEELSTARMLYDRVDEHVRYDKSKPGYGNGDVAWVCDSRFGNCTDFHSLFISLARAKGLPARFEIGFPLPPERGAGKVGGYHCWAFFYAAGRGWIPVDVSEADKHPELKPYYFGNLTEDRVTFSTGRDISLVPKQSSPLLNFFVYPHVEVDGQLWPKSKIDLAFGFADQP